MKTHWITSTIIATAFFLAPAGLGLAKDKEGPAGVKGRVTAVDATAKTITISAGKKSDASGPQTFAVTTATVIKIDGTTATLADIKPKMNASVVPAADGKTAKRVTIKEAKKAGASPSPSPAAKSGESSGGEE